MPSPSVRARGARLVGLLAVLAALVGLGRGPLGMPLAPRAAAAWAGREPPIDVVFSLLRLAAIAAGTYLLVTLVLVTVADAARFGSVAAAGRRMLPVSLHGLLAIGAGAAAVLVPAVSAGAAPPPTLSRAAAVSPPTLRRVEAPPPSTTTTTPTTTTTTTTPPPTPVPTTLPGTGAPVRPAPPLAHAETRGHPRHHERRPERRPRLARKATNWVTVEPGDSFWSIASREVAGALGHAPSVSEVAPYWSRLVAANADRIPVPGQPDVLFPGDRLILPPGGP